MRLWCDEVIEEAKAKKNEMYAKLCSYVPDEKLDRDDIRNLMFILNQYGNELRIIQTERKIALSKARRSEQKKAMKGGL